MPKIHLKKVWGGGAAVGIQAQRCQTSDLSSEPDIEIFRLCILNLPTTHG